MNCQVCSSKDLYEVLDLGHHPPSDKFLSEKDLEQPEIFYPLKILFCDGCKLVQLSYVVDPKVLFGESFIYRTGFNNQLKNHFQKMAEGLGKKFSLNGGDLVIDIGSNDGTLLSFYPKGAKVLGIDPSSVADIAIQNGIPTIKDFFNLDLARKASEEYGKAKIITCNNTFAHVKELGSVVDGVRLLLDDKGVFVTESHYLLDLVLNLQHSEIYLEHLRYYSLESLINLFKKFGMEVFDAERIESHGGSIRAFACKKGAYPVSENIQKVLDQENRNRLNEKTTLEQFREKVFDNKIKLNLLLSKIKSEGSKIVGIGAPAKGNTILNFCNIDNTILDYCVEKSDLKIGKYTPGTHIKVVEEARIFKDQPEYALLLTWDIKDIIIPKLRAAGYKGKFIVPVPEPKIIE